jgi:hypothetical protein
VKSFISNSADVERGIWQCVKYQAVLEAMQAVKGLQGDVRVLLVTQNKLTDILMSLKNTLGVETTVVNNHENRNANVDTTAISVHS